MAAPPATAWVIRPSHVYRRVLGGGVLCGAFAASAYAYGQPWGLSSLLILVVLSASTLAGILALQREQTGTLLWDGAHWLWADGTEEPVSQLDCALDFQRWMLLRLRLGTEKRVWLWAESDGMDPKWRSFRRAVVFGSGATTETASSVTGA
jgi:hypothetical protein